MIVGYVLGIDTSTTATKALLVDDAGVVAAAGSAEYAYETPRPLWAEQDPELWWEGTVLAAQRCLQVFDGPVAIDAIGLTGQMHGLVLLDGSGAPLRPAILWNDQRTEAECDQLRERIGRDRLVAITGNDALPGFTASKVVWVGNHEPDKLAAARHLLLPKDYVRYRLTGEFATDKAGASGSQMFDLAARDWSPEITSAVGLDAAVLPATHEGPTITGRVTPEAGALLGIVPGIPVVAGGGDQAANAVGTGAINEGDMALSLGTSGVVFAATETPAVEPAGRVHAFCHAVVDRWHMMGVMLSAAGSMRWLRDTVAPGASFAELSAEAATVPAGAEGLIFLPYLTGERTPHPDPMARGAFIGLTVRHDRGHLVRAVMEGVAFGLRDGLELMEAAGVTHPRRITASGGGMKSDIWPQILADVLRVDLAEVATEEGAAYGAAVLAAAGAGWRGSAPEVAAEWVRPQLATAAGVADYSAAYSLYREQYPLLRTTFARLGEIAPPT